MLASCRMRMPVVRLPSPFARLLEDVVDLQQHLDRQSRGQDLHQLHVLGGLEAAGVDAHQVIGERRQLLRVESVGAELLEQGVVPRLAYWPSISSSAMAIALASSISLGMRSRNAPSASAQLSNRNGYG